MKFSQNKIDIENYETKEELLGWQKRGLMYTSTGYGDKIPTSKKIRVDGRWYRIYCCIFSNSGICYIRKGGELVIIRD